MILEGVILELFREYYYLLAYIAGFVIGDVVIILGVVSGTGKISFWLIILFAWIGGICHDILYYHISNSRIGHYVKKRFKLSKKESRIAKYIEKFGGKSYFVPVLLAKFIYGVRDAVILYVAHNDKKFKNYLFIVSITELIWLIVVTGIGWLAGRGFTTILSLFRGVEKLTLFVLIVLIIYFIIVKIFTAIIIRVIKNKD